MSDKNGIAKNWEKVAEGWRLTFAEWRRSDIPETRADIRRGDYLRALHNASGLLSTMYKHTYRTTFYLTPLRWAAYYLAARCLFS